MNPLTSHKRLLIAESELNRAQLVQECQTMRDEVHAFTNQARSISSIALAIASLVAGLATCWRKASAPEAGKPSWLQTILKSAGMVSNFWQAFRSQGPDQT
jgi:hypothetical protein